MIPARPGRPARGPRTGSSTTEAVMRRLVCLAVFGVVAGSVGFLRADDDKSPLDKVPAAVAKAAKKRFAKAEVVGASKETEDGKTVYEVSVKDAGHKTDATFTEDGKLVSMERQIEA